MSHLNQPLEEFPEYQIRSCTNTGVWVVESTDPLTGMPKKYDFVNKEYSGPETGGAEISFESLGGEQERSLLSLQKTMNKALLKKIE